MRNIEGEGGRRMNCGGGGGGWGRRMIPAGADKLQEVDSRN